MSQLNAQNLADLVGSPFAAQLVDAMPEPAVIVSSDERAAAANKPALNLLPGLRVGDPFVLGLRAPDVVDARRRVMASGEAETVQWSERVPVERLFDVYVAPLATAAGDRDELLRVAENLIENAIKYGVRVDTEAPGVVDVAVSTTEKEGALTVRDYGHGIAPENLPRLTERFYRVDPTQSRAKNGTG